MKNSLCKSGYLRRVQKYCPSLTVNDLQPWPAGVRAQAVSPDGKLIDDFLFVTTPRSIHTCNALPGGDIRDTYRRAYRQQSSGATRKPEQPRTYAACGTQRGRITRRIYPLTLQTGSNYAT